MPNVESNMANDEPTNSGIPSSNLVPGTKKCPFCKEVIMEDALKCKHCGSILVPLNQFAPAAVTPVPAAGNTVQIVTNTVEQKPSFSEEVKTKYGHGWAGLIVSVILLFTVFGQGETTPDWAKAVADLGAIIIGPWMIWILSRPHTNKVLPVLALLITAFVVVGANAS